MKRTNLKKTDTQKVADNIVRNVAEEFKVQYSDLMNTNNIENDILKVDSELNLSVYKMFIEIIVYISLADKEKINDKQIDIANGFVEVLVCTKEHKKVLQEVVKSEITIRQIQIRIVELETKYKLKQLNPLFIGLLGIAWTVILSDNNITTEELKRFRKLKERFKIKDKDANEIRNQTETNFLKAKSEIEASLRKENSLIDKESIERSVSGITASFLIVGLADATGFGLFMFASTTLKAIGLLFGVTFGFSTYTTLAVILGHLTGPVGWIGIPTLVATTLLINRYYGKPDYPRLYQMILYCTSFRGEV